MIARRYVPLAEFELWRHLMESRHGRDVTIEATSYWIAEQAAWWNSGFEEEQLQPVLRLQFERVQSQGVAEVIERFFPAETYPEAQEAMLSHFCEQARVRLLSAMPGYFVPGSAHRAPAEVPA